MNAIVTAGGTTQPGQPLYEITNGGLKAMISLEGKPMVQWVLDALSGNCQIENVVLVGLPPETDLLCAHPLFLLPDQGNMVENIRAGAREVRRIDPQASHAVLISGDLPAIRPEIIDWMIEKTSDREQDIYYTVVERATMEAQFPKSKRTYAVLKNLQVCGGDLHCFRIQIAIDENPLWKRLIDARKSPIRQASLLGYDTLFFLMLRQLSLKDAEETVSKRLGIRGKAVLSPYAEIGMDVDKPFQLEIIQEYLASREKNAERAD